MMWLGDNDFLGMAGAPADDCGLRGDDGQHDAAPHLGHTRRTTAMRSRQSASWPSGWPAARSTWRNSSAVGVPSSGTPSQQKRKCTTKP